MLGMLSEWDQLVNAMMEHGELSYLSPEYRVSLRNMYARSQGAWLSVRVAQREAERAAADARAVELAQAFPAWSSHNDYQWTLDGDPDVHAVVTFIDREDAAKPFELEFTARDRQGVGLTYHESAEGAMVTAELNRRAWRAATAMWEPVLGKP